MKRISIALTILAALFFVLGPSFSYTTSPQPPIKKTGAPGEGSCIDCHTGGAGSGNVTIAFNGPGDKFVPDSTYQFTVTVNDGTKTRFGFCGIAVDQIDSMAGSFLPINFGNTSLQSNATFTKQYIGHANATTSNSWTFKWTAPPASQGATQVTFYVAGNAANGDFANTGDNIYFASRVVMPSGVGIPEDVISSPVIWQAGQQLYINMAGNASSEIVFNLYDLGGRVLRSGTIPGHAALSTVDISTLLPGVYIIGIDDNGQAHTLKFRKM